MAGKTNVLSALRIQMLVHRSCTISGRSVAMGPLRRAGVVGRMGASVGETGLQHETLPCVGRESLTNSLHLLAKLRHGPDLHDTLHNSHVTSKEFSGIRIQVRVRGDYGNLRTQVRPKGEKKKKNRMLGNSNIRDEEGCMTTQRIP